MDQNLQQPQKKIKNAVYFDMDDTLHEAEDHVMAKCWDELLRPWGIVWSPTPEDQRVPHLRYVKDTERPGVGIRPRNVIEHFIKLYDLDPGHLTPEAIQLLGLDENEIDIIIQNWPEPDTKIDVKLLQTYSFALETARKRIPEQIVDTEGVVPIEGAYELISSLKEQRFAVGVITSGSKVYALKVLEKLGFINSSKFPEPGEMPESELIDALIAGDEVRRPKPDIEPKLRADQEIQKKFPDYEINVRAIFGDSRSDALLADNAGIPKAFIRESKYLTHETRQEIEEKLGSRLHIVDSWYHVTPETILETQTTLEGQKPPHVEGGNRLI